MRKFLIVILTLSFIGLGFAQSADRHYTFNSSTCPAPDASGNGYDATCNGDLPTVVTGQFDDAWYFDGSGDYATANKTDLENTNISATAWVRFTASNGNTRIVTTQGTNNYNGFRLDISDGVGSGVDQGARIAVQGTDGTVQTGNSVKLNDDNWHFLGFRFWNHNDTVQLYVDGEMVNSSSGSVGDWKSNEPLSIGARADGNLFYDGDIDEVRTFSEILTESDFDALYNSNSLSDISFSNFDPSDGAIGVNDTVDSTPVDANISFTVSHSEGQSLDVDLLDGSNNVLNSWTGVSSGSTLEYVWEDLDDGTTYNWKVNASDGSLHDLSKVNGFTTEEKNNSASPSSLQLDWPLDSGCPADDESGNGFTGSCNGSPTTGVNGLFGSAYTLDGTDDFIYHQNEPEINPNGSLSFSASIKTTATFDSVKKIISNQETTTYDGYFMQTNDGGTAGSQGSVSCHLYGQSSDLDLRGLTIVNDGNWHTVTCVWDDEDNEFLMYIDGDLKMSTTGTPGTITSDADFSVGARAGDNSQFFDGSVDNIKFYNDSLSSSQVQTLSNEGDLVNEVQNTLNSPSDGERFDAETTTVQFNWTVSADSRRHLVNTSLYNNASGSWTKVTTKSLSGQKQTVTYSESYTNETVEWGVKSFDNESSSLSSNRTFTVKPVPSTLNIQHVSDWHIGNGEGDTWKDDLTAYRDFTENQNWADVIVDTGDLTECGGAWEFEKWISNYTYLEEQTGADYWFSVGNHDGFEAEPSCSQSNNNPSAEDEGWSGLEWMYRNSNITALDWRKSKGNIDFINLAQHNFQNDSGERHEPFVGGWEREQGYNEQYFVYPMHKRDFFEQQLDRSCSNDRNPIVFTHDPLYHSSIFSSKDWFGIGDPSWQNTSNWMKDAIDDYPNCKVRLVTGHVHTDPDDFETNTKEVLGGHIVWGSESAHMPDNMIAMQMPVIAIDHARDRHADYPSVVRYQLVEGQDTTELQVYDVSSGNRVGINANNTSSIVEGMQVPLNTEVDLGQFPDSRNFTEFEQEWNINQFSDEGVDVQWFNYSQGFWPKRDGWIISRWKYLEAKRFDQLNVTKTDSLSLSHRFRVTNESDLTGWSQWYSNLSNAPQAKYWSVNTSFNGTDGKYIYDMSLESTVDTPPTSSDNWTETGYVDKSETTIEITATDSENSVSNISYRIDGGAWTTVSGSSTTVTISGEGSHSLEYYAIDTKGNNESINTETVKLDTTDPSISYAASTTSGGTYTSQDWIFINVSCTDNLQVDSCQESFDSSNSSFVTNNGDYYWTNHTNLGDGTYNFYAWVKDGAGSYVETSTRTVTLDVAEGVSSCSELQDVGNDLTADYKLTSDIDCSGVSNFDPIGGAGDNDNFSGTFDGQGHTINNLYIFRDTTSKIGLFGELGSSGTVKNVGLVDVDITGKEEVGGLVGSNYGNISKAFTTGTVKNNTVDQTGNGYYVGGLVGWNRNDGSIHNSYSRASVLGDTGVGGLVGYGDGDIFNSYSTGSVSGSTYVGGLLGNGGGITSDNYWDTETSGQSSSAAGSGLTTDQMTYPNAVDNMAFSFGDVWHRDNFSRNNDYPALCGLSYDCNQAPSVDQQRLFWKGIGGTVFTKIEYALTDPDNNLADIVNTVPSGSVTEFTNTSAVIDSPGTSFDYTAEFEDSDGGSGQTQTTYTLTDVFSGYVENSTGTVNTSFQVVNLTAEMQINGDGMLYDVYAKPPSVNLETLHNGSESSSTAFTGTKNFHWYFKVDHIQTQSFATEKDAEKTSTVQTQYVERNVGVENNWSTPYSRLEVEPATPSIGSPSCSTKTVSVSGNSKKNISCEASGDFLKDENQSDPILPDQVTIGQNFTAVKDYSVNNTVDFQWTNIDISGNISTPTSCLQTNNSAVDFPAKAWKNASIGFDCSSGSLSDLVVNSTEINSTHTKYVYTSDALVVDTDIVSGTEVVVPISKDGLTDFSSKLDSTVSATVDGIEKDTSWVEKFTDVEIVLGTDRTNSSIHQGTHNMTFEYVAQTSTTDSGGNTGSSGGDTTIIREVSDGNYSWEVSSSTSDFQLSGYPGRQFQYVLTVESTGDKRVPMNVACGSKEGVCDWITISEKNFTLERGGSKDIIVSGDIPSDISQDRFPARFGIRFSDPSFDLEESPNTGVAYVDFTLTDDPYLGRFLETVFKFGETREIPSITGFGQPISYPFVFLPLLLSVLNFAFWEALDRLGAKTSHRNWNAVLTVVLFFILYLVL